MTNEAEGHVDRWNRLAACLRQYRDEQRDIWGDIDEITLSKYLCNTCSPEQREAVDLAVATKPAVRQLLDVVRSALAPSWHKAPLDAAEGAILRLSEQLSAWIDDAGVVVSAGAEALLQQSPAPAFDVALDEETAPQQLTWHLPIDEWNCVLNLCVQPAGADRWRVISSIAGKEGEKIASELQYTLLQPGDLPVVQGSVSIAANTSTVVPKGEWEVRLARGDDERVIPIQLGEQSQT